MIISRYRIAPSAIPGAGKGLFLSQSVPCGSIIVAPAEIQRSNLLAGTRLEALPETLAATSIRWFEDCCTVDPEWSDECYINHSFAPNGLWHLGFVFALRDLDAGTELTVDYRMLLREGASPGFRDALTGQEIAGFSWQDALRRAAALLQEIAVVRHEAMSE